LNSINKNVTLGELVQRGWAALQQADLRTAVAIANEMVHKFPDSAEGWLLQSEVMVKLRRLEEALNKADKALSYDPNNIDLKLHKIKCLMLTGASYEAGELANTVADQTLKGASQNAQLGLMYDRLAQYEAALKYYLIAANLDPNNANNAYSVGVLYRNFGDTKEAVNWLEKAIELNPGDYNARFLLSDVITASTEKNNLESLKVAFQRHCKSPESQVHVQYALAKELEDLGEYIQAFEQLQSGASLRRKHINYEPATDLKIMREIADSYPATACIRDTSASEAQTPDEATPIFIIGLPRTGTTLVERILNSHGDVASAGETNHFSAEMVTLCRQSSLTKEGQAPSLVSLSTTIDFEKLGQGYIDKARPVGDSRPFFIEKMPLNFLYAGLIHRALPNAKIIHLQRNPMDACYAIYKRLFADIYPFSYDQQELGNYYLAYRELMLHWNEVMPGVIHNVNYEDLVADQEGESRKLLEFCELPWQDACMNFHKNKEASTTASASQVRQKVYSSSVGKWRHYEQQLMPLYECLKSAGIALD